MIVGTLLSSAMLVWGNAKITRQLVEGLVPAPPGQQQPTAADEPVRVVNVLVVGSDSREGLSRAQVREFGTGRAEGDRSDTIMLAQLEVNGPGRAAVLSFPRDLHVERCDGSLGRINAAYGVGVAREGDGASCLVTTVSRLTGVDIHHYAEVSFAGFLEVVDAVGGVDLHLEQPLVDDSAHLDLPAGCVHLEGRDALAFVRARHLDSDFGRIARQQRFVKETVRQAASLGVLANPARLLSVVEAAASSLTADSSLGLTELREIAMGLRGLTGDRLIGRTVPGDVVMVGGASVVQVRAEEAEDLYASFRDHSVLGEPATLRRPAPVVVPPLVVENAAGTPGLAAATAEALRAQGLEVAAVGDAATSGATVTTVVHPPELRAAASKVSAALPAAEIVEGGPGTDLTVRAGSDLDAASLTAWTDRPTPRPTPTPSQDASEAPTEVYAGAVATDGDC